MTKQELIQKAWEIHNSDKSMEWLKSYPADEDSEVAALLYAWLNNGVRGEDIFAQQMLTNDFGSCPLSHIDNYIAADTTPRYPHSCFMGILTHENYHNLLIKIHDVWRIHGGLANTVSRVMRKGRCQYLHEALAILFADNTGFATKKSNCASYRFNLYIYIVAYKLRISAYLDTSKALLPCSDKTLSNAFKMGILGQYEKPTLTNAVVLTKKAREWFGERDFYLMYELLNQ